MANNLIEFGKAHYVQGEYVRIDINSDVYNQILPGLSFIIVNRRYWGEVLSAIHATREDGTDASEYKVSLAADLKGQVIGEASFVGTPPFVRVRNVPTKTLIKKFIRS